MSTEKILLIFKLGIILGIGLGGLSAQAEFDTQEPLLFPAGIGSADVLRPKEWMISSPPWGWLAYGLSEKITLGLDYQTTLFGFPAAFTRFQLTKTANVEHAIELYGVIFPIQIVDRREPKFLVDHRGGQEWLKISRSEKISSNLKYHAYIGANYADYTRFASQESPHFSEKIYENAWSPMLGAGIEWKMADWIVFNLNTTYGNTFFYFDQIAYKSVVAYSFLMAPFPKSWAGIFSRARLEMTALWVNIPDANYSLSVPIPISPYLYWQFGGL